MPHSQLEYARAIVTGASSGIGEPIARAFASAGALVIVNYRSDEESADRIVGEIRETGRRAEAVQADVSKPEDCGKLFAEADRHFGGVDILVANAGIQRDAAFTELSLDDWRKVIYVNMTMSAKPWDADSAAEDQAAHLARQQCFTSLSGGFWAAGLPVVATNCVTSSSGILSALSRMVVRPLITSNARCSVPPTFCPTTRFSCRRKTWIDLRIH